MRSPTTTRIGWPPQRGGFILYVVVSLLILGAILAFSLSRAKSGTIELLSHGVEQNRLLNLAQAANQEIVAQIRSQANQPTRLWGNALREAFGKPNPLAAGHWLKAIELTATDLPYAHELARDTKGKAVNVEGCVKIVVTGCDTKRPTSLVGYLEIVTRASRADLPHEGMEIKDRRELKLVDLRDFFDKYVLYVKNYVPDYNDPDRRLTIQGIPSRKAYSYAYLGNRGYPRCLEYPNGEKTQGKAPPPVLLDIDFKEDHDLLKGFTQGEVGFTFNAPPGANNSSKGQLFWVVPQRVPFSEINAGNLFGMGDFTPVPELQNYYKTKIVDVALKHTTSSVQKTVADEIVQDYRAHQNDYAGSDAYQALIRTCIANWSYQFGYTDYLHLIGRNEEFTPFARSGPFHGITSMRTEYESHNPARLLGGRMPRIFGVDRRTPVRVEGNVYLRFFKIAFFDFFDAPLESFNGKVTVTMAPIALPFMRPEKASTFLNRPLSKNIVAESVLMSRPVDDKPINRLFFKGAAALATEPEQVDRQIPAGDIFPDPDEKLVSHSFANASELLRERVSQDTDGKSVLDIDGIMVVQNGGLDLSNAQAPVTRFRGRGQILILNGDCRLGELRKRDPASTDVVRFYVCNGSFEVGGPAAAVTIEASLVATSQKAPNPLGMFYANGKDVTILGNLVVDFLPIGIKGPKGMGRNLTIKHDPMVYSPPDPIRASIGTVHTMYAIRGGARSW